MKTSHKVNSKRKTYPRFFIGFEFEGIVHKKHYNQFRAGLYAINENIIVGEDGSIIHNAMQTDVEIRTPKLSMTAGKKLLDEVLSYLYDMTMAGVFKTNTTCGMHVNVSEAKMFSSGRLMQTEFYTTIASKFKELEVAKRFNRTNNKFCKLLKIPKKVLSDKEKLIEFMCTPKLRLEGYKPLGYKYLSCSLRPSRNCYPANYERVEFRSLGNTDYQLKTQEINDTLIHIQDCMSTSFRELSS